MALRNHSTDQIELTQPNTDFANAQDPLGKHTVFLVDFGGSDTSSPPCGQEDQFRGRRPLLGGRVEQAERERVQTELRALATLATAENQRSSRPGHNA